MLNQLFLHEWIYFSIDTILLYNSYYDLYVVIYFSISIVLMCLLILSSTIFIGILLLLLLFIVQVLLLYFIGQHLFALFLLGVYVGAILVFFIFVVMSFIFFGKTYTLTHRTWLLYVICPIIICVYIYILVVSTGQEFSFYINITNNFFVYNNNELVSIGILLFDIDMMYIVLVISLLLLVALIGSITFNASRLVRYSSSFYIKG